MYRRHCAGLSLSSVCHDYFQQICSFSGRWAVLSYRIWLFCGKLTGLFWFVYKIKPVLSGHMVHTLQVIGRTAENNYISTTKSVISSMKNSKSDQKLQIQSNTETIAITHTQTEAKATHGDRIFNITCLNGTVLKIGKTTVKLHFHIRL